MATLNLSLPDEVLDWVEAQIRSGRFPSADAYIIHRLEDAISRSP